MAVFVACQNPIGDGAFGGDALAASRGFQRSPNAIAIYTQQDLEDIDNDTADDYYLANDLTLIDWTPVCYPAPAGAGEFTGSLDGNGKTITISSFSATALASDYLGIFAVVGDGSAAPIIADLTVNYVAGSIKTNDAEYIGGVAGFASNATFNTIKVNGTFDFTYLYTGTTAPTDFYLGGVSGYAQNTTFANISDGARFSITYINTYPNSANIGGISGYSTGSTFTDITVSGIVVARADMPITTDYSNYNYLIVGGVTGYANGGTITNADSSAAIEARSAQTASLEGGIVGQAIGITVKNAKNSGGITGDSQGYNTSAGGIAGYITQSTITASHSTGVIELSANSTDLVNNLWMIYAGGLVGYSSNASLISLSSASGAVSATSPYPYAGGLLGYNYGYNDFIDPPGNGSVVSRSFATGNVSATAQIGSNGLPYSGGLTGYSSVNGSRIENSYATGDVSASTEGKYSWAGGLIGSNAQNSVVSKCYAIGTVSVTAGTGNLPYSQPGIDPGTTGGGIAGTNYYTAGTLIEHSAALNKVIAGRATSPTPYLLHRVVGYLGATGYEGSLLDNIANEGMTISPTPVPPINPGPNTVDGADAAAQPSVLDFIALTWDFTNIWAMGENGYPALQDNL
jgi:hypothetical protein